MERRRNSISLLWAGLLILQAISPHLQSWAAPVRPDTLLARFDDAVRVQTDIRGAIYVLDASRATITKLDSTGAVQAVWGGPGSGDAELDDPADFDPTNGLNIVVADAGNRRIKRFSGEFMFLESLAISEERQVSGIGDSGRSDVESSLLYEGRPIAVQVAPDGSIHAIDQDNGVVVKWGRSRRLERVFGGYDAGRGSLENPVALAIAGEGRIVVADRGSGTLKVFDQFGNYQRSIGSGLLEEVQTVKRVGDRLIVVLSDRIAIYEENGAFVRNVSIGAVQSLTDATLCGDRWLLLTRNALLSIPVKR